MAMKSVTINPQQAGKIIEAQGRADAIIKKHFAPVLKELRDSRYDNQDLANAFIILAYDALRHSLPKEKIEEAFQVYARFGRARVEENLKQRKRRMN